MEKKYDVFISYSRSDFEAASHLSQILDAQGYTHFTDTKGISSGVEFHQVIADAIKSSRVFLFLRSKDSMQSRFAISELLSAFKILGRDRIIPIQIDDYPPSMELDLILGPIQYINLKSPDFESDLIKSIGRCIWGYSANEVPTEEIRKSNTQAAEDRINAPQDYVPKKIDTDIFISYRRVDGVGFARNIMLGLKVLGYPKVFFDYNSLRDGIFNTQILDAIYSCKDFILLISPLALKNCSRKGDWVAKEIRTALKYNKKIIPIVIEDTFKEWPADFPKDLEPIKNIQFSKLMTNEFFEDSINKIAQRLTTEASDISASLQDLSTTIEPINQESVVYKIKVNKDSNLFIDDEMVQSLKANKLTKIPLPKGEYIRKIVDAQDDQVFDECTLVLTQDKAEIVSLQGRASFWSRLSFLFS